MSNMSDFVIEDGVLKKYTGAGGDVMIPDGVTEIGDKNITDVQWVKTTKMMTKM